MDMHAEQATRERLRVGLLSCWPVRPQSMLTQSVRPTYRRGSGPYGLGRVSAARRPRCLAGVQHEAAKPETSAGRAAHGRSAQRDGTLKAADVTSWSPRGPPDTANATSGKNRHFLT